MDDTQITTDLTPQKLAWIDFVATGGVDIDEEGRPHKRSAEDLAKELNVHRRTLYDWRDTIPNFWTLVTQRRNEIYSRSRMTVIYSAMLKKAAQGDVQAAKLVMQQARILEPDKVDHTTNGKDLPTPIVSLDALRTNDSN